MTNHYYMRRDHNLETFDEQRAMIDILPTGVITHEETAYLADDAKPVFKQLMTLLTVGDVLYVHDYDRVAGSTIALLELAEFIIAHGVELHIIEGGVVFAAGSDDLIRWQELRDVTRSMRIAYDKLKASQHQLLPLEARLFIASAEDLSLHELAQQFDVSVSTIRRAKKEAKSWTSKNQNFRKI